NGNITVKINSGSVTLAQDIAMLPGAEIIIGENARCVLASGTNVYLYDSSEWGGFCAPSNKQFIPVQYAPGRKYNRTAADLKDAAIQVDGILDASAGYVYTTKSGANIFSTGKGEALLKKGSETVTYQLVQNTGYSEIPITPAKLKNADGTYKLSANSASTNYYVNGVWIEHTTHVYTETLVQTADCENKGIKTFSCPCGSTYNEETPALGHKEGAAATCTSNQICTVCGKELNPAKGHNYQISVTEPTCTTGGYTTHTCLNCGESFTDNEISAKGHAEGKPATCTENQVCTVCGEILESAKGHSYSSVVTAPTCTKDGYTTYTCTSCGDTYTDNITSKLGHTPGADATCTEPQLCVTCGFVLKSENGHTAGSAATCTEAQLCIICGEELAAALGHDMVHNSAQDATCTEDGFSSGSHCTRCDYTEGKHVIPAKGHTPNAEVTCTRNKVCTACGIVLEAAKGHNYVTTVYLPTCTQTGYSVHNCLNCGDSYADSEVAANGHKSGSSASCTEAELCLDCGAEIAPPKGHTPGAEATCGAAQTCSDCGAELAPATGHTPGARATCMTAQVCTVCDEEIIPALGHKFKEKVTEATCTDAGHTIYTCSRCRYKYIGSEVAATGHNMTAATCTEPSKCLNNCGHTEGEALGHTEVTDEEMPAFCTQDGHTEGSHCSVCGEVIVPQQIIPALGHNIVKYDAKVPTYTSVGWDAYEDCTRCAYTTYKEIPMLDAPSIKDYASFIENLLLLEELAYYYSMEVPGVDPLELVIKYVRTGVDRYNEGSWGIMAGYEDTGFAEFVAKIEDDMNSAAESDEDLITVSALKNIENFILPNGDLVDFGHMFGTMDITYHNKKSANHADVGGWAGDICDLIEFSDYGDVNGTFDEMLAEVSTNYLLQEDPEEVGGFNQQDMYGDLDSLYLMQTLLSSTYEQGALSALFESYFTAELSMEIRADYFLKNRLGGVSTRGNVRDEVYNLYTGNKLLATLEGTKEFKRDDVSELRKVCCYAFADYICKLAGDYVEVTENPYYTVFSTETTTLAPGIIQNIKKATTADNKQMVYYIATADLSRDDVHVLANYKDNDPTSWGMQTVLAQATAAQNKYGNPDSEHYIENYNVIASINGDGYNMATGEPGGLLVMDGKEYHAIDGGGFFGILDDGSAVIGTQAEYNTIYKDRVKEGIGGFGITLIKDGEIAVNSSSNYFVDRASRTAVGITKTGKVVFMVLDGRQEPISCGGDAFEIAQIMFEAGCVNAINLDGGGSTTYVAKLEGADEIAVVSRPSDGTSRSVSTTLLMVSTAPSSTAFDHAIIESETDYLTKGSSVQLVPGGVSATGNSAELPEGTTWAVSDEKWGSVSADGLFTGLRNGSVDVYLMLGDQIIGSKTMNIVDPDRIYFSKSNINATYGMPIA
ncbi:MAG: phosphodiester glycosidase family protein, partial [Clostridia bacterium]|nr:phosphodiester glycosidase family protein [Clostridia bacterium]